MTELLEWLVKQTPVIVVMGVVIIYLYKEVKHLQRELVREDTLDEERNVALQSKLDDKNKSVVEMANKALKITLMYEQNSTRNTKEHELIISSIDEMKTLANSIRYDCKTTTS